MEEERDGNQAGVGERVDDRPGLTEGLHVPLERSDALHIVSFVQGCYRFRPHIKSSSMPKRSLGAL